jgi:superfamily II DNA helicase RecQ
MTATAYKLDRRHIKESLGLHNCFELVANSDRKNIFYIRKGIHADTGTDFDALEDICRPIYAAVYAKQHNVYVLSVV